jgi:hypothetical protein
MITKDSLRRVLLTLHPLLAGQVESPIEPSLKTILSLKLPQSPHPELPQTHLPPALGQTVETGTPLEDVDGSRVVF